MGLYAWGSCWRLLEGCPQEYGVKAASQWICDRFAPDSPDGPSPLQAVRGPVWRAGPPGPLCFLVFVFSPPPSALEAPGRPLNERSKTLRPGSRGSRAPPVGLDPLAHVAHVLRTWGLDPLAHVAHVLHLGLDPWRCVGVPRGTLRCSGGFASARGGALCGCSCETKTHV